jgi:hypothetical protein
MRSMAFRLILAAGLAAGVLAACGGGEASSPEQQSGGRRAASLPDRARVNDAEVAWVGGVIEWAVEFSGPLEAAGSVADEIAATRRFPRGVAVELETLFDTIINCAATYRSKVGEAPSERLEPVGRTLEGACQQFAVGADAALEVIDGEPASSRKLLLDEWKNTWRDAADLFKSASEDLVDYQPANTRELSVAEGATIETRIEPRFSEVAASLVDAPVEVRCWSPVDWARLIKEMEAFTGGRIGPDNIGFTGFGDQRVNLAPEACGGLVALAYEQEPSLGRLEIAAGVAALMHEAQHASGVMSEPLAECFGMQAIGPAARKLGADESDAAALASTYWEELYPTLPRSYRTPECRDGGALDRRPKSPVWP